MGWKDLIFEDANNAADKKKQNKKTETSESTNSFPSSTPLTTFPSTTSNTSSTFTSQPFAINNDAVLNKVVDMYQTAFEKLNQNGYDFFEFFKAITDSNAIDNPQMYVMAMTMGMSMDKSTTKEKLLQQADFYINELTKAYTSSVNAGTTKRQTLLAQKDNENHTLNSELTNLKAQLESIQTQINAKQSQLTTIEAKYAPLIGDVEAMLQANEVAKTSLIDKINRVKDGITKNVK